MDSAGDSAWSVENLLKWMGQENKKTVFNT